MPALVVALVACEVDLTLAAAAIGLGLRRSHLLLVAVVTLAVSAAVAAAAMAVWALWTLAPPCVAGASTCAGATGLAAAGPSFAAGASAQWAWLLAVAITARRTAAGRRLVRASG